MPRARQRPKPAPPRRSRILFVTLLSAVILSLGALLLLKHFQVPLGSGFFIYRYSPLAEFRRVRTIPLLFLAATFAGAIVLLMRRPRWSRAGVSLGFASLVLMMLWAWLAVPVPTSQHSFNLVSLAHDGAFLLEARHIDSLPDYLKTFDGRLSRTVPQMGGTRVLSNPPGATILALAVHRWLPIDKGNWLERTLVKDFDVTPADVGLTAESLRYGGLLHLMWMASVIFAYLLGREFLSPAAAMMFTLLITFNPSAIEFTPGKDPAQLLTINAMLWAWFAAWRRKSIWFASLAGAVLMLGAALSLVHFWIALATGLATLGTDRRATLKLIFATLAGGIVVVAIIRFTSGWNLPATLLAVSRRYAEVQRGFEMNRYVWFAIGMPMFLLFLSPAIAALAAIDLRHKWRGLGMRLTLCTIAVMLTTYCIGITYELPRLWVAFLPMLTFGLMIDRPLLHAGAKRSAAPDFHPKAMRAVLLIVAVHIFFTAMHWSMMDVRESEHRLITHRMFN